MNQSDPQELRAFWETHISSWKASLFLIKAFIQNIPNYHLTL